MSLRIDGSRTMIIIETGLFWVLFFSTGCAPEQLSVRSAVSGPAAIRADDIRRDSWKLSTLQRQDRLDWLRRRGEQHGLALSGACFSSPSAELILTIPSFVPPIETAMALAVSRAAPEFKLCIGGNATLKCVDQSPWLSLESSAEMSCGIERPELVEPLTQALRKWVKQH